MDSTPDIKINLDYHKASIVCRELICLIRAKVIFLGKLLELILSVAIHILILGKFC